LNIPDFVEIDLEAKTLSTTEASGERRSSPIEVLRREHGLLLLQGMENGRAFSIVIAEEPGSLSSAIVREDFTITVFSQEAEELSLVYGAAAANDREVAMLTRSMLEILGEMATHVNIPQRHIEEARARAVPAVTDGQLPIRIHSGPSRARDVYASVRYRDHWYWIDDTDFRSKRVFTFLMIMLSLAETGTAPAAPLLTVTTGG
jgi:hypothetical protein